MVKFVLSITLFFCQNAIAANTEKNTPVDLKTRALQEYQSLKGKPLPVSTDASITGLLTLDDPRKKEITRPWNYFLGLKLQNFQARGSAQNTLGESFNLSERKESLMPGIEFGVLFNGWTYRSIRFSPVSHLQASYTNQNDSVSLKSGFVIDDAYLNTAIATVGLGLNISSDEILRGLQIENSYKRGGLNYTQASTNNFANFSESAEISVFQTSLLYSLNKTWTLTLDRQQRRVESSQSKIEIAPISYELGTRIQW